MPTVQPTGAQHDVGIDEMFFSTTDAKGVILQSNGVFVRLSRYSAEQLRGAPHNIIRHPDMPGGAFHAMWQTLESGSPFVAYVHNLAADGSRYDVLATVTPLPSEGYLSVRTRPMLTDIADAASSVYVRTHTEETRLRSLGMNRRQAASAGALNIVGQLAGLGFDGYAAFQRFVLPAEVARREEFSRGFPERRWASGPLRLALDSAWQLQKGLDSWMAEQDTLAAVSASLGEATTGIRDEFAAVSRMSAAIDSAAAQDDRARQFLQPLQLWNQMQALVGNPLTSLLADLLALQENVAETRFRVALARLQSSMLAEFLAELIDGGPDSDRARTAIGVLVEAVRAGIAAMGSHAAEHRRLATRAGELIERTVSMTSIPRQLLMQWRGKSTTVGLPAAVSELLPGITSSIDNSGEALARLTRLGEQCREIGAGHDIGLLEDALVEVDRATTI